MRGPGFKPGFRLYGLIFLKVNGMEQQVSKEKLISDVKVVLNDAEELLKAAAVSTGERATELREKAAEVLSLAKDRVHDLHDTMLEKGKQAARATDDFVHDHPWKSVGIAAGVGFLIGLLVNRK
jgi:ElaB/YqjD/DUF883 family membrane-anchored ribosome-binding protein